MKKYKAGVWDSAPIIEVEIEKETAHFYIINGTREAKISRYGVYHDSHQDAKAYLINKQIDSISSLEKSLIIANEILEKYRSL